MGWKTVFAAAALLAGLAATAPLAAQEPVEGPAPAAAAPIPLEEPPDKPGPRVPVDWRAQRPKIDRGPTASFRQQHAIVIAAIAVIAVVVLLGLLLL